MCGITKTTKKKRKGEKEIIQKVRALGICSG
jgi:hypothetical protein